MHEGCACTRDAGARGMRVHEGCGALGMRVSAAPPPHLPGEDAQPAATKGHHTRVQIQHTHVKTFQKGRQDRTQINSLFTRGGGSLQGHSEERYQRRADETLGKCRRSLPPSSFLREGPPHSPAADITAPCTNSSSKLLLIL